jgi:hypothetical protein
MPPVYSFDDDEDDDDDDENDDDNKPIWAIGVLSGVRDVETYNRGCLSLRG